ncbi:uncharacterized protein LOC133192634 [Saccostrea echinata]|uniref:uncharacterized protein LOC133192634 n=1 Tax=Saccostrea echinata TaxID=191078 RepID=UPI002A8015C9|nr:uncharacterized protein LOC133192634 [Saccostrea echinata]
MERELHNKLLATLALDYLHPRVREGVDKKRFLLNCRNYLTTPRERSIDDVVEVFDTLESKGLLAPGRYSVLRELVRDIGIELLRKIDETEAQMGQTQGNKTAQAAMHDESGHYVYNTYNINNIEAKNGVISIANSDRATIVQNR